MIDDSLIVADHELCSRLPEYRALAPCDKQSVLIYARDVLAPRYYGERLGDGGATIALIIITIVVALIGTGITIAQLVVESKQSDVVEQKAAQTAAVKKVTSGIRAETQALEAGTLSEKKTLTTAVAVAFGLAGFALVYKLIT